MEKEGFQNVVYGVIADDLNEFRPGMKAAKERGIRGPLQEANLFKDEIRELSVSLTYLLGISLRSLVYHHELHMVRKSRLKS